MAATKWSDKSDSIVQPFVLTDESGSYLTNATLYNSTALQSKQIVKTSPGTLYNVYGYNSGSAQYIHILNRSSSLNNGTAPSIVIRAAANSNFNYDGYLFGIPFTQGISIANSTKAATLQTGSANCWFNVTYK